MSGKTKSVLLSTILLLLLALLSEGILQLVYYLKAGEVLWRRVGVNIYVSDPIRGWSVKPNLDYQHRTNEFSARYVVNDQGFRVATRNSTYGIPKGSDVFRVMVLGPSFAFGWGVDYENTFCGKLESQLNKSPEACGRRVEVLNAGIPSLPASNNLKWYDRVGRGYQPDLIIQFMYGTMVTEDQVSQAYLVNKDGYLVAKDAGWRPQLTAWAKESAIVFFAFRAWESVRSALWTDADSRSIRGAGREMAVHTAFSQDDPQVRSAVEFYKSLKASAQASGARLLVLHFPLSYCIHRRDISRWKHLGVADVDEQMKFNDDFCRYLRETLSLECVNITNSLIDASESARLYYWLDIHWTPRGNAEAARAVAAYLLRNGGCVSGAPPQ